MSLKNNNRGLSCYGIKMYVRKIACRRLFAKVFPLRKSHFSRENWLQWQITVQKKRSYSLVLLKWLGWWYRIWNLKESRLTNSKDWGASVDRERVTSRRVCVLLMCFFLSWCFYGRSADLNKFSWVIYRTICISNNFRDRKGRKIIKVLQHAVLKCCSRGVFMWSAVLSC